MMLVRIDDAAEASWVRSIAFRNVGTNNSTAYWPFIGGNDLAVEGEWRWQDGTQFWQGAANGNPVGGLYSNWSSGHPNTPADCATIQNVTGVPWNGQGCTLGRPYVCELY
jgi:hypothetical protein